MTRKIRNEKKECILSKNLKEVDRIGLGSEVVSRTSVPLLGYFFN